MSLRTTLLAMALVTTFSAPTLAHQCPMMASKIEAAMTNANLSQEQMAQVRELHAEGMRLHEEGKHQESMEKLAQAQEMLGIS